MKDENEKYYQSPATKEDIEKLDDKLEHIYMDMKYIQVALDNLDNNNKKLIAWTQRAGRMTEEFLEHFPTMPTTKEQTKKRIAKAVLFFCA